jgi:hypothetical protein
MASRTTSSIRTKVASIRETAPKGRVSLSEGEGHGSLESELTSRTEAAAPPPGSRLSQGVLSSGKAERPTPKGGIRNPQNGDAGCRRRKLKHGTGPAIETLFASALVVSRARAARSMDCGLSAGILTQGQTTQPTPLYPLLAKRGRPPGGRVSLRTFVGRLPWRFY